MWKLVEEQDFYLFFKLGLKLSAESNFCCPSRSLNFLQKLSGFNWQGHTVQKWELAGSGIEFYSKIALLRIL